MQDGKHFLEWRRRYSPRWIYHGLHAAPAIIWSILVPLQHIEIIRKRWPALHRGGGYIVLTGSLVLSMTGYWLNAREQTYTHENLWHLHNLSGLSPIGWPTFALTTWLLGPPYLFTLFRTAQTARNKNFDSHRRWAVAHSICAYAISLERLAVFATLFAGWILALFPKERVYQILNLPDTMEAKASAELDTFALANVVGGVLAIWWFISEWRASGYLTLSFSSAVRKSGIKSN